jgi:hypothetical protein
MSTPKASSGTNESCTPFQIQAFQKLGKVYGHIAKGSTRAFENSNWRTM